MDIEQSPTPAAAPTRKRLSWKIVIGICLIALGLFAFGSLRGSTHPASGSAAPVPVTVAVAKVIREDLAQEQIFEAEFRPYQEIDLHAKVAGFVDSIKVDIGDQVQQGDVLATLEIPELKEDLDRATASERRNEQEINRASAAYEDAHISFTRLSAINKSKPNLIAQQDLDTARARDEAASAALAATRQEVDVSKAEVAKLKAMQDYCRITAPFSGVITRRYADEGALIQGGVAPSANAMPLVRLSQNDRLRLDFPVSVSYVERIKFGDPVEIRIPSANRTMAGKISRFSHKVSTDTRTMEVEVDVPNASLSLIPGIYAIAALKLDTREHVLTIPNGAISNFKTPTVFVLGGQNQLEERAVTLGLETADKLEIISGLKENELVLIGSRARVKLGQKVEPKFTELGSL